MLSVCLTHASKVPYQKRLSVHRFQGVLLSWCTVRNTLGKCLRTPPPPKKRPQLKQSLVRLGAGLRNPSARLVGQTGPAGCCSVRKRVSHATFSVSQKMKILKRAALSGTQKMNRNSIGSLSFKSKSMFGKHKHSIYLRKSSTNAFNI